MSKLLKFFTTVSVILFLVAVLLVYAFLPDPSGLLFNKEGLRILSCSKNTIFYSALFIFVVLQVLFILFNKSVLAKSNTIMMQKIQLWFRGMHLAINLFIILMLIFIGLANNAIDYTFSSIHYLAYLAPSIVILWLLTLSVFLFMYRRK